MLHILLTILKIIGIVLLVLIGIILTLLLLVLFVPIRYQIHGHKNEETMNARCKVKWMCGFLTFLFTYQDKATDTKLKILGIDLLKIFDKKKQKKEEKKKEIQDSEDKLQEIEDTKTETQEQSSVEDEDVEENVKEEHISQEKSKQTLTDKIRSYWEKVKAFPSVIREKIRKIKLTIKNICDKINYWKEFLLDERTRAALVLVKDHLLKLLKHIFPKKIKGNVTFGFDDPYKTGQVLAGASAVYPLYAGYLTICPDFTQQILLGSLELKGRIYLFYILKSALAIFFNKNIQYIIHIFRNKEDA